MAEQPRAASLHIDRQTGDMHLHLGYSLVRRDRGRAAFRAKARPLQKQAQELRRARSSGITASRSSATNASRDGARRGRPRRDSRKVAPPRHRHQGDPQPRSSTACRSRTTARRSRRRCRRRLGAGERRPARLLCGGRSGRRTARAQQETHRHDLGGRSASAAGRPRPGSSCRASIRRRRCRPAAGRAGNSAGGENTGGRADARGQANAPTDGPAARPRSREIKPLGKTAGEIRAAWNVTRDRDAAALAAGNRESRPRS